MSAARVTFTVAVLPFKSPFADAGAVTVTVRSVSESLAAVPATETAAPSVPIVQVSDGIMPSSSAPVTLTFLIFAATWSFTSAVSFKNESAVYTSSLSVNKVISATSNAFATNEAVTSTL